jgi:hypothetical protein
MLWSIASDMRKREDKNIKNLVATDGFHFSGSGLINDIFRDSGYVVPKNIRADELFSSSANFSWPKAINGDYDFSTRAKIFACLVKRIIIRIPLNIMQKTPFYGRYLVMTGRGEKLHQSSSVNRSLWSYVVSIRMLFHRGVYNEETFTNWLYLKYRWHIKASTNLLLDNGISKNAEIAQWFFNINGSTGIIVFRNPRVQYQQISQVYKATGKLAPNYHDFLVELNSQYSSMSWLIDSNFNIIFVSFDQILNDKEYLYALQRYFQRTEIIDEIRYDFSRSLENNQNLVQLSEKMIVSKSCMELEKQISNFHKTFLNHFADKLSR